MWGYQEENHIFRACGGILNVTMYLWGRSEAQLPIRDGEIFRESGMTLNLSALAEPGGKKKVMDLPGDQ